MTHLLNLRTIYFLFQLHFKHRQTLKSEVIFPFSQFLLFFSKTVRIFIDDSRKFFSENGGEVDMTFHPTKCRYRQSIIKKKNLITDLILRLCCFYNFISIKNRPGWNQFTSTRHLKHVLKANVIF